MSVHSLRNPVHSAFAADHLFRDCFAHKFEYRLLQTAVDTFAVRIGRWVTIISQTGVVGIDCRQPMTVRVFKRQRGICLLTGAPAKTA